MMMNYPRNMDKAWNMLPQLRLFDIKTVTTMPHLVQTLIQVNGETVIFEILLKHRPLLTDVAVQVINQGSSGKALARFK